ARGNLSVLRRWYRAVWILAFTCLVLGFSATVWKASQSPQSAIKQVHPHPEKGNAGEYFGTEKEKADEALARYTWWLTFFTGVLAFATAGLGVATVGLYLAGERQLKLIEANAAEQSRDMKASVAVAEAANELNRSQFLAIHRPWIAVKVGLAGPFYCDGRSASVQLSVTLKNVGTAPGFIIFPFVKGATSAKV